MEYVIGFFIAAAIGLTGVGGGTLMTPVLILFLHVPVAQAVGTALLFTTAVKILAAPVYVSRRQVHWRTLAFLIAGGLPGVLAGSLLLSHFNVRNGEGLLYSVLGLTIVTIASLNLYRMIRNPQRGESLGTGSRKPWSQW